MNKITILKLKKSHLLSFVKLWNQEYKLLTSSGFKMTFKKAREGFRKKMFDYFGAFKDKKLIGFILLKKESSVYWIKHLSVDKELRNKGIGKKLLAKAVNLSKKYNLLLKTEVLKENKIALNFFLKNNFKIEKYDKKEKQYILNFIKK